MEMLVFAWDLLPPPCPYIFDEVIEAFEYNVGKISLDWIRNAGYSPLLSVRGGKYSSCSTSTSNLSTSRPVGPDRRT